LFGRLRKKKVQKPHPLREALITSIKYGLSDVIPKKQSSITQGIPFLPRGMLNEKLIDSNIVGYGQVNDELINLLPQKLRRYWMKIDFQELFKEEELPPEEVQAPEPPDIIKMTETPPNLQAWQIEKKKKLTAIALGEITREDFEKYDFDKNNKHEKSNEEFAEDDQR
jgi:hypothetical protein